jgi:glycosyltransferase involved in cell wall biosynthesis
MYAQMQKSVLLFTDSHSYCGVGRFNASLLAALAGAGYRAVCAQCREETPLQHRLEGLGVEYRWFDGNPEDQLTDFANDRMMPAAIFGAIKPDLIVFSNGHLQASFSAMEVAAFLNIPYVIREGLVSPQFLPKEEALIAACRRHYRGARQVVCVSEDNRDLIASTFDLPADFGQVIPPSVTDDFFCPVKTSRRQGLRREWQIPDDAVIAISVAKLEPVKGHVMQLLALERLMHGPTPYNIHLVWAGTGSLESDLVACIADHGLAERVHILGHVWNVAEILDAADIFILTSHAEGLPHAIVEAMAKGLAVVATDVGGAREALEGNGRLLSAPTDQRKTADELVGVLSEWSEDPEARRREGKAARIRASEDYRDHIVLERYLRIVDQTLTTKPADYRAWE